MSVIERDCSVNGIADAAWSLRLLLLLLNKLCCVLLKANNELERQLFALIKPPPHGCFIDSKTDPVGVK